MKLVENLRFSITTRNIASKQICQVKVVQIVRAQGQYSDDHHDHSAQKTGNESDEHSDDEGAQCMYENEPEYTTEHSSFLSIETLIKWSYKGHC